MLGRITREAEKLTINGSGIDGMQSVSASYTSQSQFLNNLGVNEIKYAPQGPQQATLEVNTLLTQLLPDGYGFDSRDPLQNYTGDLAFSGAVNHGSKVFQFTEGYLQSYSVSCGIGQIPQATSSSLIYGEFGTGVLDSYEQESQISPELNVTSFSSMEINLDAFKTNRVLNFNVNIATPRLPIYAIGTDVPTGVIAGSPVEVNVNFEIQPDDYEIKNMRFVPEETVFENTVITLKKNNSNDILLTYSFENMLLSSESFQGGVDSNASVNFSLRSFILR
tara:strand:+ start:157 stop:990 length:834 start_codon:yes stop_codon:yes gene_type:complete